MWFRDTEKIRPRPACQTTCQNRHVVGKKKKKTEHYILLKACFVRSELVRDCRKDDLCTTSQTLVYLFCLLVFGDLVEHTRTAAFLSGLEVPFLMRNLQSIFCALGEFHLTLLASECTEGRRERGAAASHNTQQPNDPRRHGNEKLTQSNHDASTRDLTTQLHLSTVPHCETSCGGA